MPVMITFSSSVERRLYARAMPMARMEMGMAASITWPTLRPEYAAATVKSTQSKRPQPIERPEASSTLLAAGTIGAYTSPGLSGRYAFSGSERVSPASISPPGLESKKAGGTV